MSHFSTESDLYDTLCGIKMYNKGGYYTSDELECFELFKEQTGGIIYQSYPVKVSEYNLQFVADHCSFFSYTKVTKIVKDKRYAKGEKEIDDYTYTYFDTKYKNLTALNKRDIFVTIEIPFNTIFDLAPYYGYAVTAMTFDKDTNRRRVTISNEPIVHTMFKDELKHGLYGPYPSYFIERLWKHYIELAGEYYFKDLNKRTKIVDITNLVKSSTKENFYEFHTETAIDHMHQLKFVFADRRPHTCTSYPILQDSHTILLSAYDIEHGFVDLLKENAVKVQYVEKMNFENNVKEGVIEEKS